MSLETNSTVVITTKNTPALTMGIIAIVLGVLALLVSWVPFLGLFSIPVSVIGGLLAFIGLILAAIKKFKGWSMPTLGGLLCGVSIAVALASTGGTSAALAEGVKKASEASSAQKATIEAEQKAYIASHLVVENIEAKRREMLIDGKVPTVGFTVKNTGAKTVTRLKVICYFLDASGKRIAEESFIPVSAYGSKPLKPGYTWKQEENRHFTAKSVPSDWKEGAVQVEISEIDFE